MKRIISVVLLISTLFAVIFYTPANAQTQITGITVKDTQMFSNAGTSGHAPKGETSSFVADIPAGADVY